VRLKPILEKKMKKCAKDANLLTYKKKKIAKKRKKVDKKTVF